MPASVFPELAANLGFTGNPLDRLSEKRDDATAVATLRARPDARCAVLVRDMPVLRPADDGGLDCWFLLDEAVCLGAERAFVLLGELSEGPRFALLLTDASAEPDERPDVAGTSGQPPLIVPGREDLTITDLRSIASQRLLPRQDVAMLGQAKSILHWHVRHGFCAHCGVPTRVGAAGWRRECEACKAQHFPRTDPVVIMLVTDGERCLLGRSGRFGKGMYSALAGFLEPGETIEEAVRREVREEAGILVGRVTYVASQPWPFPSSLMIGCLGEAVSSEITIDHTELEDARWFTRAEVAQMLERAHPDGLSAPQPIAIARHLLSHWAGD